jgi:hypothetical protein
MGLRDASPKGLNHRIHIGLRDDTVDQLGRRLQEYASGLAPFIPDYLAAGWIFGGSSDARQLERAAIHPGSVMALVLQRHRVIANHGIQVSSSREGSIGPDILVPSSTLNPLTRGSLLRLVRNPSDCLSFGGYIVQVDLALVKGPAVPAKMDVSVNQAGNGRPTRQINGLSARAEKRA